MLADSVLPSCFMTIAPDRAEADINRHSATFKKELGLRDLVLTQVALERHQAVQVDHDRGAGQVEKDDCQ